MLRYFDIKWSSYKDGPGKRVVLFLRGCPLHCIWCHSPHLQPCKAPLLFYDQYCRKCSKCHAICPNNVHEIEGNSHRLNRQNCNLCGKCAVNCPFDAISLSNYEEDASAVFRKLLPELLLLKEIGGLTISGGEPLLQTDDIVSLLTLCRTNMLGTAIETCGAVETACFEKLIPCADCWLFGLKHTDPGLCESLTGADFSLVYKNLQFLARHDPEKVIIRTPVIPDYNDQPDNLCNIAEIMVSLGLKNIELLGYNPLTPHYYEISGREFNACKFALTSNASMNKAVDVFKAANVNIKVIP